MALIGAGKVKTTCVIILLGSLIGLAVPLIQMMGKGVGVGSNIANSSGAFFFVWTL